MDYQKLILVGNVTTEAEQKKAKKSFFWLHYFWNWCQ